MNRLLFAGLLAAALWPASAAQAETTQCTVIDSVPVTLTAQGVYCLKGDLATGITSGSAIEIATNNVTIDMNGFKLGGLSGGPTTDAFGISSEAYKNIVIRNGSIRGFAFGVALVGNNASGGLVEDVTFDGNLQGGVLIEGSGMVVRENRFVRTSSPLATTVIYGVSLVKSQIADNLVSDTSTPTGDAFGILLQNADAVDVKSNTVTNTDSPLSDAAAIRILDSTNVVVRGNRLLGGNGPGINEGISVSASTVFCRDNVIDGFAAQTAGCTAEVGTNP